MHRDPLQPRPLAAVLPTLTLVVLLLLTLMAIPMGPYWHGRVPQARSAAPAMKDRVTIGVDKHGQFWLLSATDPGPIPAKQLSGRLRAAFAGRSGEEMYLRADRSVEYIWVQRAIAAASEAGVLEVQLIVACPEGRESLARACRGVAVQDGHDGGFRYENAEAGWTGSSGSLRAIGVNPCGFETTAIRRSPLPPRAAERALAASAR